jgi:arabinofuranan 3-O-arabinosyltransferase
MSATLAVQRATGGDAEQAEPAPPRSVERLRLLLITFCLALLVVAQSAGNTSTDTKVDLVVSPLRFLSRALRLWDPVGAAGQLQNQAYGYLFPMGPFFALTDAVGLPAWESQRVWEACLVIAAFLGTYLLSGRLGVQGFWPRVAAGLVYALAPRTLSELTSISSELLPMAVLPWVVSPLVDGARGGSPRRAAAQSGVALLFAGGVNAAATLAVLPVPALWLLTRERGPRRRALMSWWVLAVVLACAWWLIPLLLLGKYSPPFLDWIEASSTTTLPTSLLASLRGVDHWESYLGPNIWPAGWIFASAPASIVATAAVAGAGLAGLAVRRIPHRLFLWATLLLGLVLVTAGHAAAVGPPGASTVRSLLDGPLVAFRNVHKFDPLIRLPLAIGVGHLLAVTKLPHHAWLRVSAVRVQLPVRLLAAGAAAAIGLVAVSPALTNHLVSSQRVTTEPGWWRDAGSWLGQNSHGARALVVPGSASPVYLWGGTVDNALQPVATTPWTTRDSVPLTQAGYIRLLDAIEQIMSSGASHPELAPSLARAGIGYVVVANDLDTTKSAATHQLFVRATLADSPGFALRKGFGPRVGGSVSATNLLDGGAGVPHPAVEIYQVTGWDGLVGLEPLAGAVVATGSADALPQLVRRGLPVDRPVLFGADADGVSVPDAAAVTTDGIRRRQATFGALIAKSATMTALQPFTGGRRAAYDYLPDNAGSLSVVSYEGIAGVNASSSGSDVLAYFNRDPAHGPWSALDGDPRTAWASGSPTGAVRQWLQVTFPSKITTRSAQIRFASTSGALPTQIVVRTDAGALIDQVRPVTTPQTIAVPAGETSSLRVTVSQVLDHMLGTSVGIAELSIPGVTPSRTLRVPSSPLPDVLAFDAAPGYRDECLGLLDRTVCDSSYAHGGEEDSELDRTLTLAGATSYLPSATVRLRGGAALDGALDAGQPVHADASSVNSTDPRQRPGAMVDGDLATTWQAAPGDVHPVVTLLLDRVRRVDGLTLHADPSAAVAGPREVVVRAGKQRWSGAVPADGRIHFASAVATRRITITVRESMLRSTTSSVNLRTRLLPVGISEITLGGAEPATSTSGSSLVELGCDSGVALSVDGVAHPLRVAASRADVLAGAPVAATPCVDPRVHLAAGTHRLSLGSTSRSVPVSMTLTQPGETLATSHPSPGSMSVQAWGATERKVRVDAAAPALLVVRENQNAGWQATLGGHRLAAVRVDGWEQGFVVPAGTHGVIVLTYAPQRPFAVGLIVGLLGVIAVIVLAFVRRRSGAAVPVGAAWFGWPVRAVALSVAVALLAAAYGIGVLLIAALVIAVLGWRSRGFPIWVGGVLLVIAAVLEARAGVFQVFTQANSAGSQLLCVAAIVSCAIGGGVRAPRQGRDP